MTPRTSFPISAVLVAAIYAGACADTVQLPYQPPDTTGEQWTVYAQGNLQQQGNQPVFGQAGMLSVNGQQPQQNDQNAAFDAKTGTLLLNFQPQGSLHVTRSIRFQENSPVVRVIDTFENLQSADLTANVILTTSINAGVNDAAVIPDTKAKDGTIGWAANTQMNRAALSLFAGKRAKVLPRVQYRPGNNMVSAQLSLKLTGKSKVAIVHWHGTFDSAEAATQWVAQLKESKAVADVTADVRKTILNLGGGGNDFVAGRELLRGGASDVIELTGGEQMRGTLEPTGYTLATSYGTLNLTPGKIAGLLSVGGASPRQLLVTRTGEIFGGVIQEPSLPMQLASGQTVAVPFAQITRVGVKSTAADGEPATEPAAWKFDKPMVFLTTGERCGIDLPAEPIDFVTRYGTLKLTPAQIAAVLLPAEGESQTVYLTDGSKLAGVIAAPQWAFKLAAGGDGPLPFAIASLARVQFATLAEDVGVGQSTVALLGSDVVAAKIEGPLKLKTPFDTISVDTPQVASITRAERGQADVLITLFDGTTFRGALETPTLSLQLSGGLKLDVPTAALTDYQNPRPFPAAGVVAQANAAIKSLNVDDWKQREAAEGQLTALGEAILPVLQDAQPSQPTEAKERLAAIIAKLKKEQPLPPSRLIPPPAVE